jgi:hypothetical protein
MDGPTTENTMILTRMLPLILWACVPRVSPKNPESPTPASLDSGDISTLGSVQTKAILATVADDYSLGTLATVDLDTWSTRDTLSPISGDPAVVADGGYIIQLNRYNYDTVRVYHPGDWDAPVLEFALADGANPQDADVCGGALWISQYGLPRLVAHDLDSGFLLGAVDLSALADGDGIPEASSMVEVDGVLYVSLQRLDRDNGWTGNTGTIVALDCTTKEVVQQWSTGPSPSIVPFNDGQMLVHTGLYGALDGGVQLFDPIDGLADSVVLSESEIGQDITAVLAHGEHAVVLSAGSDWNYTIGCLDMNTGEYAVAEQTGGYLASGSVNDRGEAWIAARQGYADPDVPGGIIVYRIDDCVSLVGADWIPTVLAPFSIGFFE